MRKFRFDHLLAGTAIALVLAAVASPVRANPQTPDEIAAAIPMPEPAELKILTPADVATAEPAKDEPVTTQAIATPPATAPEAPAQASAPAAATADTPAQANVPAALTPDAPAQASAPAAVIEEPAKVETAAAPVDPVVEKLKDLLTAKVDKIFGGRKERAAVDAYYSARAYAPIWIVNGEASERCKSAVAFLGRVAADGLDPADYPVPYFKAALGADALAEAELRLTASVLTFARHAELGRVHYSRVSADIYYPQVAPEPADVLAKVADAKNVADALDSYNPQNSQYKALKRKLAELRGGKDDGSTVRIGGGPVLKIAKDKAGKEVLMQDARVPALRDRLKVAATADDTSYDRALADAVAKFQKSHGLQASGQLNSATIDALNGPKRDNAENIIIANMERWRWLPHDLGNTRVILNVPDFTLRVYRGEAVLWHTKVVVGKPGTPTPLLSETMKYITVNPTWNVPPSIVYNEYLPALQQDPTVLARMGLKVSQNPDGSVHISQPPGDKNALGRIRFNFPNKFLVYQHDTPDKYLFAHDKRAYSHGCMRVENPLKYGEVLLGLANPKDGYTEARLRNMFGSAEVDIKFQTQIPVHITYQTAFVDDHGQLQIREDIYGRDARVLAALKGDERRVADIPMERSQPSYSRPSVRLPPGVTGAYYASGPSFFEALFGGGRQTAPAAPARRRVVVTR